MTLYATHSALIGRVYHRRRRQDVPLRSSTALSLSQYVLVLTLLILMQGGRLVTERRMVSDLYVFDLETCHWDRIQVSPEDDVPQPRYFHSADACMSTSS